jgi:hypothetical protein
MYTRVTYAFNFVGHGAVSTLIAGDGKPPPPIDSTGAAASAG